MTASEGMQATTSAAEIQLSHLLPALWRALTRAARGFEEMPAIESQVTILRRLVDGGESTPARLAEELYLARPTVSNLLRGLEEDGLVERIRSTVDGRSVTVSPTQHGRTVLEQFRRGRAHALRDALLRLAPGERSDLIDALPLLDRLLTELESIADVSKDDASA